MNSNRQNSRTFSAQDRLITEIDRLLAITAKRSRSFAPRQTNSDRSRHLRASHSNATAALGLRRGLQLAARAPAAQKSAHASEQSAARTKALMDQQLDANGVSASISAGIGYAGGLALGLSSRLSGDETARKLSGSLNQLTVKSQSRRAQQLRDIAPDLSQTLSEQAASQTCACGPHGHRTRSGVATRVLSQSAKLLERLSRI